MTITNISQGTTPTLTGTGTGSTTVSPDLPAGSQPGDVMVMFVGSKFAAAAMDFSVTAGWQRVSDTYQNGGGGSTAADTGPSIMAAYYHVVPASGAVTPAVSIMGGVASWALIILYRSDAASFWSVAGANGIDSTTGAPWSAIMNVDPGLDEGDKLAIAFAIPTDISTPAQWSGMGISATGATFANGSELAEPETTTGNDEAGFVAEADVASGPSSGVATITATAGGTTTNVRGVTVMVRIREVFMPPLSAGLMVTNSAISRASIW